MRGIRTDCTSRYKPVPQAISDEDEGVYDESPESSQHTELLFGIQSAADPSIVLDDDDQYVHQELQPLDVTTTTFSSHRLELARTMRPESCRDKRRKMSCARRICFVISVVVCVLYVVAILWLIPCQMVPCQLRTQQVVSSFMLQEWITTIPSIYLISRPQPVVVNRHQKTVIVFAYHTANNQINIGHKQSDPAAHLSGVVAIHGKNGSEVWKHPFYSDILDLTCNVTDVNGDGIRDCFVTGKSGLLAAISASSGITYWYLHTHHTQPMQILAVSPPCLLTGLDFDGDGIEEFVVVAQLNMHDKNGSHNELESSSLHILQSLKATDKSSLYLLIVSGSTGQMLGQQLALPFEDTPTQDDLPMPVLYNLGNGTQALLLHSGNPVNASEILFVLPMMTLYKKKSMHVNHTLEEVDDELDDFRDIFTCKGKIGLIKVLGRGTDMAANILCVCGTEFVFLNGSNDYKAEWSFNMVGSKLSEPSLGYYNNDRNKDVFFTAVPLDCNEKDCKSRAIVLDGRSGKILKEVVTQCVSFNPLVIASDADVFIFKTVMANIVTEVTDTTKIVPLEYANETISNLDSSQVVDHSFLPSYGFSEEMLEIELPSTSDTSPSSVLKPRNLSPVQLMVIRGKVKQQQPWELQSTEMGTCNSDTATYFSSILQSSSQLYLLSVANRENYSEISSRDLRAIIFQG